MLFLVAAACGYSLKALETCISLSRGLPADDNEAICVRTSETELKIIVASTSLSQTYFAPLLIWGWVAFYPNRNVPENHDGGVLCD